MPILLVLLLTGATARVDPARTPVRDWSRRQPGGDRRPHTPAGPRHGPARPVGGGRRPGRPVPPDRRGDDVHRDPPQARLHPLDRPGDLDRRPRVGLDRLAFRHRRYRRRPPAGPVRRTARPGSRTSWSSPGAWLVHYDAERDLHRVLRREPAGSGPGPGTSGPQPGRSRCWCCLPVGLFAAQQTFGRFAPETAGRLAPGGGRGRHPGAVRAAPAGSSSRCSG